MTRCICDPKNLRDMQYLVLYGCACEICPGCYLQKAHDSALCDLCAFYNIWDFSNAWWEVEE